MKGKAPVLKMILPLTAAGCSSSSTTTAYCDDTCTIWINCTGWDFNEGRAERTAEGDWDQDYLFCIQNQGCDNLLACE